MAEKTVDSLCAVAAGHPRTIDDSVYGPDVATVRVDVATARTTRAGVPAEQQARNAA